MDGVDGAGIGALIVGGLTAITSFVLSVKKQSAESNRTDFQVVNDNLRGQITDLKAELKDERVAKIVEAKNYENEVEKLTWQLTRLETLLDANWPFIRWAKDYMGRYRHVNHLFLRRLLQPLGKSEIDILGKTDEEFWPNDKGEYTAWIETLHKLEQKVAVRADIEAVASGVVVKSQKYTLVKWLDRSALHEIVGRFGMAFIES